MMKVIKVKIIIRCGDNIDNEHQGNVVMTFDLSETRMIDMNELNEQ